MDIRQHKSGQPAAPLSDDSPAMLEDIGTSCALLEAGLAHDYIIDIDSFTGLYQVLVLHSDKVHRQPVQHTYDLAHVWEAKHRVHPEDRQAFCDTFTVCDLLAAFAKGSSSVEMDYRWVDQDNTLWKKRMAFPYSSEKGHLHVLIYVRDITDSKKLETAKRALELRYDALFRQSCNLMLEVNLDTGQYIATVFGQIKTFIPLTGDIDELYRTLEDAVHPEDRQTFIQEHGLAALRAAHADQTIFPSYLYRLSIDEVFCWIEGRVFFTKNSNEPPTAYILARDVSEQKSKEEVRDAENQRLSMALRNTYTEIYDLDTVEETAKLLFNSSTQLVPVDNWRQAQPVPRLHIVNNYIHPDDRKSMWSTINGDSLRKAFAAGQSEVTVEFRRISHDGGYIWLCGTAMPLQESQPFGRKALFFLKDITQRKEKEEQERVIKQYGLALRNIYDFFYEFNLTRGTYRALHHAQGKFVTPTPEGQIETLIRTEALAIVHPDDIESLQNYFAPQNIRADFANGTKHRIGEFRTLHSDGDFQWTAFTMFPQTTVQESSGQEETYIFFGLNIHTHKIAEEIARRNLSLEKERLADERYRIVVQQTDTLIFEWKSGEDSYYISPLIEERFAGNYDGRPILQVWAEDNILHPQDLAPFEIFSKQQTHHPRREITMRLLQRKGGFLWCKVAITTLSNEKDQTYHCIGTINDVDQSTRAAQALRQRAEHDQLTGLFNVQTFYTKAVEVMHRFPSRRYFIIRLDIDDFKLVNEVHGMDEGDKLLKKMARTLQGLMVGNSVCGRLSGDVFCACVDFDEKGILHLVDKISAVLNNYPLPGSVQPSFGICQVENINTPIHILSDWANLALKSVKGSTLNSYAYYEGKLRDTFLKEKRIKGEMHQALARDQFVLFLQPKVHMPSRTIVGAEGLVRWRHPVEGTIAPDEFIPLFERNGFIIPLDEYIWEESCKLLRHWQDQGRQELPLSINVSRLHLASSSLCHKLEALLRKYDLAPHLLELELTESIFLDNKSQSLQIIETLRSMGFRFALDDFGAGFSSLNMLKNLSVETLKVDRGFFDDAVSTEKGKTVVRHVISLAKDMNMTVIAEGVENENLAQFLCSNGCVLAQGYHYSPPVPIVSFEEMLQAGSGFFTS